MDDLELTQQDIQNLKARLRIHENNLRDLELQRSQLGITIDIQLNNSIINEIDEINKLKSKLYSFKINKIKDIDINSRIHFNEISNEYLLLLNKLNINIAYYYDSIRNGYSNKYYECYDLIIDNLIHFRSEINIISDEYSMIFKNIDVDRFIKREIINKVVSFINLLYFDSERIVYEYTEGNIVDIVNKKARFIKNEMSNLLKLANELSFINEINDTYYLNKIFIEYIIYKSNYNNYLYNLLKSNYIESNILINKDLYEILIKNQIFINIRNISNDSSFLARNYSLMVEYSNFNKDTLLFNENYINSFPLFFINENQHKIGILDKYLFNINDISISKHLISNADFKCFLFDNGYSKLEFWSEKGKIFLKEQQDIFEGKALLERDSIGLWNYPKYWFHYGYNHDLQPVVGISYYEAEAYCNWLTNKGYEQGWLDSTEEIRLPSLEEWMDMMDHQYPDINNLSRLFQLKDISTLFDYPYCINCFSELHENIEICDIFGNVWEWTTTKSDTLSFYITGGSFLNSWDQISAIYEDLTTIAKESKMKQSTILDTAKSLEMSLESNGATRRLPNLGFRIIRAIKAEFIESVQDHLHKLLKKISMLDMQITRYGGLIVAPLHLINQLSETKEQVKKIEVKMNLSADSQVNPKSEMKQPEQFITDNLSLVIDANPTLDDLAIKLQLRGLRIVRVSEGQSFYGKTKTSITAAIIDTELLRTNRLAIQPYLDYLDQSDKHNLYIVDNNYMFGELEQIFDKNIVQVQLLDPDLPLAELAKIVLEDVLIPILGNWDNQKALDIDIFSYQQAEYAQPALLCIDTRKLGFEPADWATLMQAFYDLREVLNASAAKRLAVRPMNSRLSVAMAFGAVFSSAANFEVTVAYERRGQTSIDAQTLEWWRNHNNPNPESLTSINQPTVTNPQQEAIVCLSVSRHVKFATQEYVEDHQLSQLMLFEYSVAEPGINAVAIGDEGRAASAIANQFGHLLRTHRDTMARRTWHFFYALPVALAVLVGQELNACTPIQCYEFMNDRNPAAYIPSCLIKQN